MSLRIVNQPQTFKTLSNFSRSTTRFSPPFTSIYHTTFSFQSFVSTSFSSKPHIYLPLSSLPTQPYTFIASYFTHQQNKKVPFLPNQRYFLRTITTSVDNSLFSAFQEQVAPEPLTPQELIFLSQLLGLPKFNPKGLSGKKNIQFRCFDKVFFACQNRDWSKFEQVTPYLARLTNKKGGNIIHYAVEKGFHPLIEQLLAKYYDQIKELLEKEDDEGRTPVSFAVYLGEIFCLNVLATHGASLTAQNKQGRQPIHFACIGMQKPAIDYLAAHSQVKLAPFDKKGKRPEDLLREENSSKSQEILSHLLSVMKNRPKNDSWFDLPPENLAFQGGGIKGIAYVGVLEELENRKVLSSVERVAGTSAGAITALLVALGYKSKGIAKIFMEEDLSNQLDHPKSFAISQGTKAIWQGFIHEGEVFRKWINGHIRFRIKEIFGEDIPYPTFGDLKRLINKKEYPLKHLYIMGMGLGDAPGLMSLDFSGKKSKIIEFSSEDPKCDDIIISDAIRISMSIPILFRPHLIHCRDKNGQRISKEERGFHVDGGVLCNLPDCFDRKKFKKNRLLKEDPNSIWYNPRTWSFSFSPAEDVIENTSNQVPGFKDTLSILAKSLLDAESIIRKSQEDDRIVRIDSLGISATEFGLIRTKKEALMKSGANATKLFLKKYEKGQIGRSALPYDYGLFLKKEKERNLHLTQPHVDFFGRGKELQTLEQALLEGEEWQKKSKEKSIVKILYGPSGYGKSQLASTFACMHLGEFSFIWQLDFRNQETLLRSYRELAQALGFVKQKGEAPSLSELVSFVNKGLEECQHKEPWLLIFDNADEERELDLPQKGGCILITTQKAQNWPSENLLNVPPFSPKEACQLLKEITSDKDDVEIQKLAEALGYIPLLLNYAAYYLLHSPEISMAIYRKKVLSSFGGVVPSFKNREDYHKVLVAIAQLSLKKLQEKRPEAAHWLHLCTYLHSQDIPIEWVGRYLKNKYPISSVSHLDQYLAQQEILGILEKLALIYFRKYDETFSLHGLLQKVLRETDENPLDPSLKELVQIFSFRTQGLVDQALQQEKALQGETIASFLQKKRPTLMEDQEMIEFYQKLGWFHLELEEYDQAWQSYEAASSVLGEEHGSKTEAEICQILRERHHRLPALYAKNLHYRGKLFFLQKEFDQAKLFHDKAIAIREQIDRQPRQYEDPDPFDTIIFQRQGTGWLLLESEDLHVLKNAQTLYESLKQRGDEIFSKKDEANHRYCDLQLARIHLKLAHQVKDPKHYKKAQEHLSEAMKTIKEIARQGEYLLLQGELLLDPYNPHRNLPKAEEVFRKAIAGASLHQKLAAKGYCFLAQTYLARYEQEKSPHLLEQAKKEIDQSILRYEKISIRLSPFIQKEWQEAITLKEKVNQMK